MAAVSDFALSAADRNNPLWMRLKRRMEESRDELRNQNDSMHLGERETAFLRGRIAAFKELLALEEIDP